MKNFLFLFLLASLSVFGETARQSFKNRPMNLPGFNLVLSVDTNFSVPLVGKDLYWGRVYFKDSEPNIVAYRDEMIAENFFVSELKDSGRNFNYSSYRIDDINGSDGLSLIEGAGADVNLKSDTGTFNIQTGGRLTLRVKGPGDQPQIYKLDIVRTSKAIQSFLLLNGKRIAFSSFKVNADTNFLGATTIMAGIKNIEFFFGGKIVTTINQ